MKEADNAEATNGQAIWISIVLFFAFFVFYFLFAIHVVPQVVAPGMKSIAQSTFSFVIAISIVAGAFLIDRMNLLKVILTSSAFILLLITALLLIPNSSHTFFGLLAIFVSGMIFGFGQLAFFAYFWQQTPGVIRGKVGGKIALIALLPYFVLAAVGVESTDISDSLIIALVIISIAFSVSFIRLKQEKKFAPTTKETVVYPEKRTILLYSIPWISFCLINATLSKNIDLGSSQLISSYFVYLSLLQAVTSLVGAYGAGVIADYFGRRPALAVSITVYGVSMAFYGFVPNLFVFSFAVASEALGWGMLLTLYSFIIWGD